MSDIILIVDHDFFRAQAIPASDTFAVGQSRDDRRSGTRAVICDIGVQERSNLIRIAVQSGDVLDLDDPGKHRIYISLERVRSVVELDLSQQELRQLRSGVDVEVALHPGLVSRAEALPALLPLKPEAGDPVGPLALRDSDLTGVFAAPVARLDIPKVGFEAWELKDLRVAAQDRKLQAQIAVRGRDGRLHLRATGGQTGTILDAGSEVFLACEIPGPEGRPDVEAIEHPLSVQLRLSPRGDLTAAEGTDNVYVRVREDWSPPGGKTFQAALRRDFAVALFELHRLSDEPDRIEERRYYLTHAQDDAAAAEATTRYHRRAISASESNVPKLRVHFESDLTGRGGVTGGMTIEIDGKTQNVDGFPYEKLVRFGERGSVRIRIEDPRQKSTDMFEILVNPEFERRLCVDWGSMHHLVTIDQKTSGSGDTRAAWTDPEPIKTELRRTPFLTDADMEQAFGLDAEISADVVPLRHDTSLHQAILPASPTVHLDGEKERLWQIGTERLALIPHDNDLGDERASNLAYEIESDLKFRFWQSFDRDPKDRDGKSLGNDQQLVVDTLTHLLLACDMQDRANHMDLRLSERIIRNAAARDDVGTKTEPLQIVATYPLPFSVDSLRAYAAAVGQAAEPLHRRLQTSLAARGYTYNLPSGASARGGERASVRYGVLVIPEPLAVIAAHLDAQSGGVPDHARYISVDFGRRTLDICHAVVSRGEDGLSIPLGDGRRFALSPIACFGFPLGGQNVDFFLAAAIAEVLAGDAPNRRFAKTEEFCKAFVMSDTDLIDPNHSGVEGSVYGNYGPVPHRRSSERRARSLKVARLIADAKHRVGHGSRFRITLRAGEETPAQVNVLNAHATGTGLDAGVFEVDISQLVRTRAFRRLQDLIENLIADVITDAKAHETEDGQRVRMIVTGRAAMFQPIANVFARLARDHHLDINIRAASSRARGKLDVARGAAILARAPAGILPPGPQPVFALFTVGPDDHYHAERIRSDTEGFHGGPANPITCPEGATHVTVISAAPGFPATLRRLFENEDDTDPDISAYTARLDRMIKAALFGPRENKRIDWRECRGYTTLNVEILPPMSHRHSQTVRMPDLGAQFEIPLGTALLS